MPEAGDRRFLLYRFARAGDDLGFRWIDVAAAKDEADNHLLELALAGGANHIVTGSIRDFSAAELRFPNVDNLTPRDYSRFKEM